MTAASVTTTTPLIPSEEPLIKPKTIRKGILIALSAIFAVGMVFAYAFGAPWIVIAGLFALALSPLFPLGKVVDDQRHRIHEN